MANLDFYASRQDLLEILSHVFEEGTFRVFESYSRFDHDLREFHTSAEVDSAYVLGTPVSVLLALWAPSVSAAFAIEKILLKRNRSDGATHRFAASGWGLIHLALGGPSPIRRTIASSNLKHNSVVRATNWESTLVSKLGPTAAWDWPLLERSSRKLRDHISHHLASAKVGSRPVLRDAAALVAQGYTLV